ncbi:MAG: hypothetical protein H8M99_13215 [Gloeobacteraceae cyanobacterium ES-bin-144]|nr:hypothetical protein [Verrucomicrobiales bacterium]
MLLPVFRDLIKKPWLTVIEALKISGGQPVTDLAREIGSNYMTVKTHCEDLTKAGYLIRTRLPRIAVGRPEIFYSLSNKADSLFPSAGLGFTLELLDELKLMHGENAPEKLLFQYFQKVHARYAKALEKITSPAGRLAKITAIRNKEGCTCLCENNADSPLQLIEFHNPLQRIFERYPRAASMELRMIESLLGARVTRRELPGGRESTPRVVFEIA